MRIRIEEALIDLTTVQAWLGEIGWTCQPQTQDVIRIVCPEVQSMPFFARITQHWLMLTIVPVIPRDAPRPADLSRRLLAVNRDMRLAKYAYDADGSVALTAELPTESLDASELRDAVQRMARYVVHYQTYLRG
jgi:hypothetical protein